MLYSRCMGKRPDAIIILGGGTDGSRTPVLYTKERLEAFAKLKERYAGMPVVLSGGWSWWIKERPRYTEADVMERFLLGEGWPKRLLYRERRSRDTVGNFYHAKQIVKRHGNWRRLLVVTSRGHAYRCRWLAKRIFGPNYSFGFLSVPSRLPSFSPEKRERYERWLISRYRRMLGTAKDGDDRAVLELLKRYHPGYSKTEKAKRFDREAAEAKRRILGYVRLR